MSTIREIFLVLALLLLIGGAAGHRWVLNEQAKEQQALQQQQEKFETRVAEAGKVLDRELKVKPFSGVIAPENLQDEPAVTEPPSRSNVRIVSFACLTAGSAISAAWIIALIAYYTSVSLKRLKQLLCTFVARLKKLSYIQLIKDFSRKYKKALHKNTIGRLVKLKNKLVMSLSRLKNFFTGIFRRLFNAPNRLFKACVKKIRGASLSEKYAGKQKLRCDYVEKPEQKIDTLYCDEKSNQPKEQTKPAADAPQLNPQLLGQLEQNIRKTILAGYHQSALNVQNSLKTQNEAIEKQVSEVIQMAQTIQQASSKNSEPVKSSLDELARQISAIREYTTLQHSKIEKLQEGYDWNIIKNFCLRVIRCIDNLENRIARLSQRNIDTADLVEIMDELVFALESSGIEQFRPQINSEYNGNERTAEVTKDRAAADDPDMRGKIAEVLRPGYQYVIDDTNVKVVRTAQVKLFG